MLMFLPRSLRRPADPVSATALAERVGRGDRLALEEAYRREAGPVYRYALALCGNPAWAADATHEAFIAFAQHSAGFDERRGSLGAYLAGVARHSLLAQWRHARQEAPAEDPLEAGAHVSEGSAGHVLAQPSPEHMLVQAQSTAELWAAMRQLPWAMREALVLVDVQERPYAEAAHIAGIELNTLRTRLHRARVRLAQLLGAKEWP